MTVQIIHHDIKPANVLLDASMTIAKIGDLGVSRILAGTHATATVVRPTKPVVPAVQNL